MSSWTNDVDDSEESESDESQEESQEESEEQDFESEFLEAVEEDSVADIGELELLEGIEEVDDEDALREAWISLSGEKQNIVKNRITDLTGEDPSEESESDEEEDADEEEESSSSGWGGSDDDEEDSKATEPAIESAEEIEEQSEEEESESDEDGAEEPESDSSGPPQPSNSITPEQAAAGDRRWKIMVWGPPKLFKTHFAYTMPEPIAFLDLEGKADDLAAKFQGRNVQIWQPKNMTAEPDTKFRRAKKALDEALEWLDWHRENEGKVGTIVVDSMSLMWEWAQVHHKLENYPLKDEEDIELSSNFGSSQESDWAVIKEYHNGEFRERITDSEYHFLWTAMERVEFERTFDEGEGDMQFMEPTGEPKNDYKADTIIHARKDPDRGKVGDLTGSNFTDNVFVGLKKPTFPKVRDAVERIQQAEGSENPASRSELSEEIGAETIIDYDPQVYVQQ